MNAGQRKPIRDHSINFGNLGPEAKLTHPNPDIQPWTPELKRAKVTKGQV